DSGQHDVADLRLCRGETFVQQPDANARNALRKRSQDVKRQRHVACLTRIVPVPAGRGLEGSGGIFDGSRQRTGVVDALLSTEADAEVRDEAEGWLHAKA